MIVDSTDSSDSRWHFSRALHRKNTVPLFGANVTSFMKSLVITMVVGATIAFLSSCTPSNPSFRFDEKPYAQTDVNDAYVTPKPRKSLWEKRIWRR